jgi:hypothetical protein
LDDDEKAKGLKTLKNKRDGLFAMFKILIGTEDQKGVWTGQPKNHKYPFKFLRSFLRDVRW